MLACVYCSLNTNDTASLKDQFETIEQQMMPVPPAASGKYDNHIMLGDFNVKIGLQEPTPVTSLPQRKGYTITCVVGRSLLRAMTNRLCLDVHPTRFMALSKQGVQKSIIDHILCKPADWSLVKDKRTHPCSGAEIAHTDHNMISIDLHLAP